VKIYVAPGGNDRWSGSQPSANRDGTDGPLATLPAALERSREARRGAAGVAPQIVLREGVYVLDRPLLFLPQDSGLNIAARRGEKPVISGETQVTGWQRSRVNSNIWQVEIPAACHGAWQFHELFVNGRRKQRARLPVSGFFRAAGGPITGHPTQLRVNPGDIKPEWASQGDVELVLIPFWSQTRNQIRSYSEASNIVTLAGRAFETANEANARYYIENAPDSLAPGEWHLDSQSGTVTYWPEAGEDVPSAIITAPHLYELARLEGQEKTPVRDVVFRGLTFAGTDWPFNDGSDVDTQAAVEVGAAFEAQWAEACMVQHCIFTRLGGYAINFGRGCRHNMVTGCEMYDLGAGGVRLGDTDGTSDNWGNTVDDNHIHHIGLVNAPAVGVFVLSSASDWIAHNEIDHTFSIAISVGWTWGYGANQCRGNLIEFNHLHDIGQGMLSDMGGVYTLGVQPGTVVRENLIHDVSVFAYGGWGLYTDEGSSDIVLESNIVYRCQSAGFHQHYGENNLLYNNIFALNHDAQLARTRPETHLGFVMTNNIVYFNSGRVFSGNWASNGFVIDHNIYFDTRAGPSHPPLDGSLKFEDWHALGYDVHSLFIDPLFVAPEKGDFRLRRRSPALRFGFHPLDLRAAGVRKEFAR
jgi:parallel beta-helix repeat protein